MACSSSANKVTEAQGGEWRGKGQEVRPDPGAAAPPYLAGLVFAAAAAGGAQGPHALLLVLLHLGLQVLDVHEVGLLLGLPGAQLQLQGLLLFLQ